MRYTNPKIYELLGPNRDAPGGPVPLMLDSPHSGTCYPDDFKVLVAQSDLRRVADSHVDALFENAPDHAGTLLKALFPRTYIDANRAVDDIDPMMISDGWPTRLRPTEKSRLGHGLIWQRFPPNRPLYATALPARSIRHRIDHYWHPYHEALEMELLQMRARFGTAWHLNCHSMPETSSPFIPGRSGKRADFVLGDRDGESCESEFTRFVCEFLEGRGYRVRLNDPYRGAELIKAYANPAQGIHSLQIEINRGLYMDEQSLEQTEGFAPLRDDLTRLVAALAGFIRARLAHTPAEAAE